MFCSKCNTEIPQGAKFCPACGQKAELSLPKHCGSCGIELELNAKFCPICGTPADSEPAAPAAAPVSSIPQPVSSIPQPVSSIPQPAPSEFGFGGSTSATRVDLSKGGTAPFSASGNIAADTAQPSALPDYGFSAASAAVAAPIKKSGAKIGAIIGIAAAVVVAAFALIFVLNKGPMMNLFMGNKGYAAMLEGKTVDAVTDAVANPVVTSGVEALSSTFASAMETASEDIAEGDLAQSGSLDYSKGVDFAALIANANRFMDEAYGTSAVSVSVTPHVELTDTAKALITESEEEDEKELEKILSAINGAAFVGNFSAGEKIIGMGASATEGGFTADAKMLMTADGKMYISFPFGSDKAIMIPIEQADSAVEDAPTLVLEEKEIERLAQEIGDIYLKYYENGEITVEKNGTLTAAGASAGGKLITVDIKGGKLSEMFAEIADAIAEDEYFRTTIVSFANACGSDLTEEEYKEEIKSALEFEGQDSDILRIMTVVNKNNDVLAKSFCAIDDKESVAFTYIDGKDNAALDIIENGTTLFSANIEKKDEYNGSANLKFSDGDSYPVAVKLDYADLKSEKFLKSDVMTGTLTFSVTPPADFTDSADETEAEILSVLAQSEFILSCSLSGSTYEGKFTFDCPQYGKAELTALVSGDAAFDLSVPTNVIDASGIMEGDVSDEVYEQLDEYLAEISEKAKQYPDSYLAQALADSLDDDSDSIIDEPTFPEEQYPEDVPDPLEDERDALCDAVSSDIDALYDLYYDHMELIDDKYYSEFEELQISLYDIYSAAYSAKNENQLDKLNAKLNGVEADLKAFAEKVEEEDETIPETDPDVSDISVLPEVDYDLLSYDELLDALSVAEDFYLDLVIANTDILLSDDAVYAVYEDSSNKYNDVCDDVAKLNEAISEGSLSIPLLREARKSAAKFDESIRALYDAIYNLS